MIKGSVGLIHKKQEVSLLKGLPSLKGTQSIKIHSK